MPEGPIFTNDGLFRSYLKYVQHFKIHEIPNNNDSMYAALAYLLFENEDYENAIREVVALEIEHHTGLYQHLMFDDFEDVVNGIRNEGAEGGYLELVATARVFRCNIVVYQMDGYYPVIPYDAAFDEVISISLHEDGHFNALEPYNIPRDVCRKHNYVPKYEDDSYGMVKVDWVNSKAVELCNSFRRNYF